MKRDSLGNLGAGRGQRSNKHTAPATATPRDRSLRSRWNRSFTVLFAILVIGGTISLVGTGALVGSFRDTARRNEQTASLLAQLRADIMPHAVQVAADNLEGVPALEVSIRDGFKRGLETFATATERKPLQQASERWEAMVAVAAPRDHRVSVDLRLAALTPGVAETMTLLDVSDAANRAEARSDLARGERVEWIGMLALAGIGILIIGLMLRFARRLSVEVLRPVGLLRDSANQLASGELDRRVELDRTDELGDLAASFNTMAEAIAGSQQRLFLQANHDSLTGLANRAGFQTRLEAALTQPERRAGTQAVLFIDLDDFKDVNDTLGHAAGDELLKVVATRLQDTVRPNDLVARLGGDEFAVLLNALPEGAEALSVAERVVHALAAPVEVHGTWVHVGASIGVAMRDAGSDPESLMREADVAMYTAKGQGKNRVERYDTVLHGTVAEHAALKMEVASAAARGELFLDHQPS